MIMFASSIISFREFLEAFIIIGVFLGISQKLALKREREIKFAAGIGFVISFLLAVIVYSFGDLARVILTEGRAEILESYLLIFSGFFIAYVVFSLHDVLRAGRGKKLISAHQKLSKNAFDVSLFVTIVMLVVREGFEIALFTASTSLFSTFLQNLLGFLIGFFAASVFGVLTYLTYLKFSINKIFKATEYMIILLGASFVQNGLTKFLEHTFNIALGDVLRLPLSFLPSESSLAGHLLQSLTGIDKEFSTARLGVMILYILVVYTILVKKRFPR